MRALSGRVRLLAVAAAAVTIIACSEQLSGGMACPALCPGKPEQLQDTTFFAVVFDTSIAGYPALGTEQRFYIASFGDTLETAAALRFDSLPMFFKGLNSPDDSTITAIDTGSVLKLTILPRDTLTDTLETTVEVYDVDLDGAEDNDPALAATAFTPDRLLGSRTVPADSLKDFVNVPIDPAFLLARIQDTVPKNRMRLGVRVTQAGNAHLSIVSTNGAGAAQIVFRPSLDTLVPKLTVEPFSRAPNDVFLANDMADYLVVIKAPAPPPADVFRVGGLPAGRAYLRFDIPSTILDSSDVVRATLFLTQRPNPLAPQASDTVGLGHFGVVAGSAVLDLTRALFFLQRLSNRDTLRVVATDSGVRSFEMIDWVRAWRGTKPEKTPRAIGFATAEEGENGRQLDFFSIEAPIEVRPRLRLTYRPRSGGPLP